MKLQEAQKRLALAREIAKKARKEVDHFREITVGLGGNPNPLKTDNLERNKAIYKLWKEGQTFRQIAKEFKKSPDLVSKVCHRIDHVLSTKKAAVSEYKDLLPYK